MENMADNKSESNISSLSRVEAAETILSAIDEKIQFFKAALEQQDMDEQTIMTSLTRIVEVEMTRIANLLAPEAEAQNIHSEVERINAMQNNEGFKSELFTQMSQRGSGSLSLVHLLLPDCPEIGSEMDKAQYECNQTHIDDITREVLRENPDLSSDSEKLQELILRKIEARKKVKKVDSSLHLNHKSI